MARTSLTGRQCRLPNRLVDKLTDHDLALDAVMGDGLADPTELVSASGAVSITKLVTFLSVTGTKAYTLANGTYIGQRKIIRCTVAASTPAGTLTPVSLKNGTVAATSVLFDAVEDALELVWNGTAWDIVRATAVAIT